MFKSKVKKVQLLQHFNVSGDKGTAFLAYKQIFLEKITQ